MLLGEWLRFGHRMIGKVPGEVNVPLVRLVPSKKEVYGA